MLYVPHNRNNTSTLIALTFDYDKIILLSHCGRNNLTDDTLVIRQTLLHTGKIRSCRMRKASESEWFLLKDGSRRQERLKVERRFLPLLSREWALQDRGCQHNFRPKVLSLQGSSSNNLHYIPHRAAILAIIRGRSGELFPLNHRVCCPRGCHCLDPTHRRSLPHPRPKTFSMT